MREALGWSAPTLRAWGSEGRPARPRASSAARVVQLRDLCRETGKWVADPWRVGEWTLEPQSQLQDTTPAKVVLSMGEEGVNLLVKNMARVAPKERAAGPVDIPVDKLRETLTSLDAPSVASAASGDQADVDLSDFDD